MQKPKLKSIDQYENTWWVRLGRFLRLSRIEILEVDATPQDCIEFIQSLEHNLPEDISKIEISVDTFKRPYRFFYSPTSRSRRARMGYIKGQCTGKEVTTRVEIEAFPGNDGLLLCILCLLFFGSISFIFALSLHPRGWGAFFFICFLVTGSFIPVITLRNDAIKLLRTDLTSLHTTNVAQLDEEPDPLTEEAPRQDSAQG